jgi:hypothetical protein
LEGHKEGIPLGIHLRAIPGLDARAHHGVVLAQQVGVGRAELLQQARGAYDVGEQEGDSPAGQAGHIISIATWQPKGNTLLAYTRPLSNKLEKSYLPDNFTKWDADAQRTGAGERGKRGKEVF